MLMPSYPQVSGVLAIWILWLPVLKILSASSDSKVTNPVIASIAVHMIDIKFTDITINIYPRKPMCAELFFPNENCPVTAAIIGTGWLIRPRLSIEMAGERLIYKEGFNLFLRYFVQKNTLYCSVEPL